MNKVSIFLVFGLVAALVTSCGDPITINKKIVTGEASHISCRNAVISGKASIKETASTDLTFGVLYSTNSGVLIGTATQIQATSFDSDYNFSVFTEVLEPETTYYYRSYISQNGEITYGDTKSFTTLPVRSMIQTLDATDINACEATLNARLDLTDCVHTSFGYGFIIYKQGGQSSWLYCTSEDISNHHYSRKTGALSREQDYEFAAYVELDDRHYIADKKPFTTQSFKAAISINDATDITELRATVTGQLIIESDWAYRTVYVYYHDQPGSIEDLKKNGKRAYGTFDENGLFTSSLSGLEPGKVYYYMAVATVFDYYEYQDGWYDDGSGVSFSSDVKTFTTAMFSSVAPRVDSVHVDYSSAAVYGTVSVNSIEPLEKMEKEVWLLYLDYGVDSDALKDHGLKRSATVNGNRFVVPFSRLADGSIIYYIICVRIFNQVFYDNTIRCYYTSKLEHNAVDMGLSVKWRGTNLGITVPYYHGTYYAWGETMYKSEFDFSTYLFYDRTRNAFTKYVKNGYYGDNKTVLERIDDAASQSLGDNWRIPTLQEWQELLDSSNCEWTYYWLYDDFGNGTYGSLVTSRINGNSIFFPEGYYWSSSLSSETDAKAWGINNWGGSASIVSDYRPYPREIRPVSD